MSNYIAADIRRVLHKQSFLGALGAFVALFAGMVFVYFNLAFTAEMYVAKTTSFLSFFPLAAGLFVFMAVYADDFKCRSMQVAIGYGISRQRIVLGKLVESMLLLLCAAAIMGVFVMVTPGVLGLEPNARNLAVLVFTILAEMLRALGYAALASVAVFFSQNAVNGIIVYVLLASKTVYIALTIVLGQEFLVNAVGDWTKYLYTAQLYAARTLFVEGKSFYPGLILAVLWYVVLPTAISAVSFSRKELEF